MDGVHRQYVVDASSWISVEGHPAQNQILFFVGKLIEQGKIICPPEAWGEVKKCPWVKAWLAQYQDQFVKSATATEFFGILGQVTMQFHVMAGARRRKERADQYVLASAAYYNVLSNPTKHVVVCEESAVQRPSRKLVTACKAFGVDCDNLMGVLRQEFPDEKWP
jgi:Domain of unknown function (DUF4411)